MVKHLVFAGGGPRCISFLGAIEVLKKNNLIADVTHFWGNSAGALMAACLSLNISHKKLRSIFYEMDFTKFRDFDLTNIMSFGNKWGLDSGDAFFASIKTILEEIKPGSSEYTMQEIPGLHITASDLTDTKPIIIDSTTYPTMKIVDALRASTSIPFFYVPFRNPINNHLLVDGAIACNFPWLLLSKEIRDDAIGFDFKISETAKEPANLSEFIPTIMNFRDKYWLKDINKKNTDSNVMILNIKGFPAWHLALKTEDRDELIKIGFDTATKWVNLNLLLKTAQTKPCLSVQNTPVQVSPSGRINVSSGSHVCPFLSRRRGSPPDLLPTYSRSFRRWSL